MKHPRYFSCFIFLLSAVFIVACSGGPPEKTPLESLTSPAILLDHGITHYNNNNYPKAIHDFDKALLQYRSIDNQPGIANSCMNLAKTYMAINNNQTASEYLNKADTVIKRAQLTQLKEHLHLLNSSLAIKNNDYDRSLFELEKVLTSSKPAIKLAALKNRTNIAFLSKDENRRVWLEKYKALQNSQPENNRSHLARILRFEAELSENNSRKEALLGQSLLISQNLANRTAIAATLSQWTDIDIKTEQYKEAENKSLRALFIRQQLGDVKNSLAILNQLKIIYSASGDEKLKLTNNWIEKISNNNFDGWDNLLSEFDTYPVIK